jgi:pimeloyl-ACP methyl ester carboxylesterase
VVGRGSRRLPGTVAGRRAAIGGVLLVLALALLLPATQGIEISDRVAGDDGRLPVRVYVPQGAPDGSAPGVVVAHGFAGSAALMHTWSLALAHAGFVVVAPDLPGHGTSTVPSVQRSSGLAAAVDDALAHLVAIPAVDADRVALLGHSMGSGAVLAAGIARSDLVRAVVAVSPTDAAVTGTAPRDLLLLAGANEGRFVANAESLLERAEGPRGEPGDGDARGLEVVLLVEHVSILFSRAAHDASIAWISAAVAHTPTGRAPLGPLAGWSLLVVAIIMVWQGFVAQAATPASAPARRSSPWLALPAGGVAATASLVIITRSVDLAELVGVLVAGEVGLWFLMVGAVWLRFGIRPAPPDARDIGWALLAIGALVGIGASTTLAWAPWWLSGVRSSTAALLALLLLPYSVAAASTVHGRRGRSAVAAWALASASVVVTLGAAAVVVPGVGFLILVLPLLPLVLAATTAVTVGVDRPWALGPATAIFLGWLLAMLFPLA